MPGVINVRVRVLAWGLLICTSLACVSPSRAMPVAVSSAVSDAVHPAYPFVKEIARRRRRAQPPDDGSDEVATPAAETVEPVKPRKRSAKAAPIPDAPAVIATPSAPAANAAKSKPQTKAVEPLVLPPPPVATAPPPAPLPPAPPPAWSPSEIAEALRDCVSILAPLSATVEVLLPLRDGQCGTAAPIRLSRIGSSPNVELVPPITINCRVAAKLDAWIRETVQPQALARFGSPVTRVATLSSYDCRNRIGSSLTRVSEHAFANAIDIAGMTTSDGHKVDVLTNWGVTARDLRAQAAALVAANKANVATPGAGVASDVAPETHVPPVEVPREPVAKAARKRGSKTADAENTAAKSGEVAIPASKGDEKTNNEKTNKKAGAVPQASALGAQKNATALTAEARFLRDIHTGACGVFGTALSPEANDAHRNHLHLDLAPRRRSAYCE